MEKHQFEQTYLPILPSLLESSDHHISDPGNGINNFQIKLSTATRRLQNETLKKEVESVVMENYQLKHRESAKITAAFWLIQATRISTQRTKLKTFKSRFSVYHKISIENGELAERN